MKHSSRLSVWTSALVVLCLPAIALADPDTLLWNNGTAASDSWHAVGIWTPTDSARTLPIAGDTARIAGEGTSTVAISQNATAGHLSLGRVDFVSAGTPATIAVDTGDGSASAINLYSNVLFGAAVGESDLVLSFANSSTFRTYNVFNKTTSMIAYFHAKISGGTAEAPCNLTFTKSGTGWTQAGYFFSNAANDFRGDLILINNGSSSSTRIMVGFGTAAATDSMLGHPDNVVRIGSGCALCWNKGDAAGFRHRATGNGTLHGCNFNSQYTWYQGGYLTLGDGCVLDPSTDSSIYGTMSVVTKNDQGSGTLTIDPNATFYFDVSNAKADAFKITTVNGLTLGGKIAFNEQETINVGATWTLFTIAAGAGSVTWAPSSVPEGYSFKLDGNNTDGWTVTATKLKAGASVQNLAVDAISETSATVHADVLSLTPDGSVTLRAYYGTTDGGENPSAWDHVEVYPDAVSAIGVYSRQISGLTLGETYYVRHSVANSAGENFSLDVVSFTTLATSTPDVFTWRSTNDVWSAPDPMWTTETPRARKVPGYPGDKIFIPVGGTAWNVYGVSRTINLDGDRSVGNIEIQHGSGSTVTFLAPSVPSTLTLATGSATATNQILSTGQLNGLTFGAAANDNLSLALAQPLHINRTSAYNYNINVYCPVSGGTDAAPTPIIVESQGDEYCHLYLNLLNPLNSFTGDFTVGSATDNKSTTEVRVGSSSAPSQDSMLGAAANTVTLRNNATLRYYAASGQPAVCTRSVSGAGTVVCSGALTLGPGAAIAPSHKLGPASGFGMLSLSASPLSVDPAVSFAIDVSAEEDAADRVAITTTGAFTLAGIFTLEGPADADPFAVGTRRTIGSVTGASSCAVAAKAAGWKILAEESGESAWTLVAEKVPDFLLILIR